MTRTALLLALLPAVAGTHPEHPTVKPECAATAPHWVKDRGSAGFRRLDKLPPANEQLTILRTEGGCEKPVIVRYGIGGNPAQR